MRFNTALLPSDSVLIRPWVRSMRMLTGTMTRFRPTSAMAAISTAAGELPAARRRLMTAAVAYKASAASEPK